MEVIRFMDKDGKWYSYVVTGNEVTAYDWDKIQNIISGR